MACASIRRASSLLEVLWLLCHFGFNCLFCFVMVCLRCHPDVGLGRWLVWFNYVPVFLSVLAVAYLLVCLHVFSLPPEFDARSKPAMPKVHRMSQHTGSVHPATDYFAWRRPWESFRYRKRAALTEHSERQHNKRMQHYSRCPYAAQAALCRRSLQLFALQILPCTSGLKEPRELTRQL